MWLDRDGVMVSLLNHTLALEQALQDNCWTVKVESCGFTVLRSYDSRFLWWGRIVFPLNDLNISPQAQPQNNKSSTVHFRLVMAFAWNTSLLSRNLSNENMSMHLSSTVLSVLSTLSSYLFSGYHSISKAKSVLIGSRGLREALCQWWWGFWLVQRHRQPTDPC